MEVVEVVRPLILLSGDDILGGYRDSHRSHSIYSYMVLRLYKEALIFTHFKRFPNTILYPLDLPSNSSKESFTTNVIHDVPITVHCPATYPLRHRHFCLVSQTKDQNLQVSQLADY